MKANAQDPAVQGDLIPVGMRVTDCPTKAEPLMSCDDVARFLQVPISWIYDNHRETGLPALRIGRHLRFRREEIDQWLDERKSLA